MLQADVRERAADHDLVVAATRAVGVEVLAVDAVLVEVLAGGAVGLDVAGGADVVGRDRIAQRREHARADDVGDRASVSIVMPSKYGGLRTYVDFGVPLEDVARRGRQRLPALVALEDARVLRA